MNKFLLQTAKSFLLIGIFFVSTAWAQTEAFKNGVRKGMVKVKFTSAMTSTLSKTKINTRSGKLTTGIKPFDAVAQKTKALNMYRLFPYDARYENKLRKHGLHLWYVVEVAEDGDPKSIATQFKQLHEIEVAEVEHEKILAPYTVQDYTPSPAPFSTLPFNDPYLADQWHYNNIGQTGFGDADVNLFEAWTQTTGANNIIVSVHDEGVDVNHKDLKANIWVNMAEQNGAPGVDDDGNGYIDDINGYNFSKNKGAVDAQYHGTHVAGTIAAVNNNGIGVSGVAGGNGTGNGVRIMSLQIFGGASIEKTYVYAANNGSVISQNSWGYTSPGGYEQSVLDAIDYFVAEAGDYPGSPMKGGIVIFAAGNSSSDGEWYPGYHHNALSVASIGPEWKRASYSNYGAWVEVAAPGGDVEYGSRNGVLSTIPNDHYAYLQGTSMACPHVSGIAALALANRSHQLTNKELWNKLVTGVVSIDQFNPDYQGMLGSGAIDAALAIKNNQNISPAAITNLTVTGITQEFATLTWTVPADGDDGRPISFELYHHTQPITGSNLHSAVKTKLKNTLSAGSEFSYELDSLLGITTYYFAVTATDRWGNASALSNVVTETTNAGPSIAVDENSQSITLDIDAASSSTATHDLTILNNADGVLRWNHFMRHSNTSLSFNAASLNYPVATGKKTAISRVAMRNASIGLKSEKLRSAEPEAMAFTSIEKTYSSWPTNIIGDTDTQLTNSAAAKFFVTEVNGFNLTQVQMYLKHNPALGPVIVEIYKGNAPIKNNLLYAQEHSNWSAEESVAYITLNEQLYFESGSTFWVAFHIPAGNLYPLGVGFEADASYSSYCYFSTDLGSTWMPLETAINTKDYAWTMTAASYNEYLGTYLTLEPGSGDVAGNESLNTILEANGETLVNGSYSANLVLASNDAQNREFRIPVNVNVSGHKPKIKHIDIADYGAVFIGESKTLELVLENVGYGNFNNPTFTISGTKFEIDGSQPWQIAARAEVILKVKFKPTAAGNTNSTLTISNGSDTYKISLFGVGAQTSKINITPLSQIKNNIAIGNVVTAKVTVKNTGQYPLKYFIPGFDQNGVSDNWPSKYHSYGYKFRTNYATEANPVAYEFQNIASTGVNITDLIRDDTYYTLDMGFEFPFYGDKMKTIFIAQKGFTTFDNSVRPINTPNLPGNEWSPKGYISLIGAHLNYVAQGEIFYQVEADRIIIQYDNVWDGWNPESITAQMVLYADGNIRFFYDNMGWSQSSQQSMSILMEDINQSDGVLIHNYNRPVELHSGLALGFDYPGPNIITNITNGSAVLAPNASSVVTITMNTADLSEGLVNRYVNFISNDPSNAQASALVQLNINSGGVARPIVSRDTLAFGNVFQGAIRSVPFTIKNPGTANVNIASIAWVNGDFNLQGETVTSIKPGLYKKYLIEIPTNTLTSLEDWLSINYANGTHDTIYVSGKVVVPPAINVDLSLLQETLEYGQTSSHPFTIQNTGLADLEVSTTGTQWVAFNAPGTPTDVDYTYEKHNDGKFYQWVDIRETGTHLPFMDFNDVEGTFWRNLELPFPIDFYGVTYTSMKIGDNGIISFEDEPQASFFTDYIPSQMHPGPCIIPYWTFSGFSDYLFPKENIGIFYQFYDDKFIITWSYFTNNFGGMGDPVSAQVVFYKNGTMKFLYKREEGGADITSHFGTIGLQKNSTTGMAISEYEILDHGNGLAYIISPAKKYMVSPGSTLSGDIVLDATNIYGGQYNASLKINNNVPNSELLEKPVELTVTGDAVLSVAESVDFGSMMVQMDGWSPKAHHLDLNMGNAGSAPLTISWAQMADDTQGLSLQIWALVDGWFGPEWRWTDISELYSPWAWQTPTFTINPGDRLKARAVFAPSFGGNFSDELVLTTSLGETRVSMIGIGFEPPVLSVDATPIEKLMNLTSETTTASIAFDNLGGASDLTYEVSIDFGRAVTSRTTSEVVAKSASENTELKSQKISANTVVATPMSTYNRTLKHTSKDNPDTFVGTGGSAPFTLATKFNAGPQGFNLSHVETWFRAETLTQGKVDVEIRAGGSSIANAITLASGSTNISGSGSDDAGAWLPVALEHAAGIYPNEDFYVLITYPLGIQFPQGTLTGEPVTPGRYYYFDEGNWYNIQEINGFETAGWLMYAAEETAGNSTWLTVTSTTSGTLEMGTSGSIELMFEGAFAQRGTQVAEVVIQSNDPNNTTVRVPVKLHINEGPKFSNVPENIVVSESESITLTIEVVDKEGNTFTVNSAQAYPGVSHTFGDGILTFTVAPNFGDAGIYNYKFTAKDEYNASTEIAIPAEILHTNRAPEFIGESRSMTFNATKELNEFAITDFFNDPDNDVFTFTLTSNNPEAIIVFASENQFLIKPMAVGESKLAFAVKDSHGSTTYDTLSVSVDVVLAVEEPLNYGLSVYPNPAKDFVTITIPNDWTGEVTFALTDATGKQYLSKQIAAASEGKTIVDISGLSKGIYILKAASNAKQSTVKVIKK